MPCSFFTNAFFMQMTESNEYGIRVWIPPCIAGRYRPSFWWPCAVAANTRSGFAGSDTRAMMRESSERTRRRMVPQSWMRKSSSTERIASIPCSCPTVSESSPIETNGWSVRSIHGIACAMTRALVTLTIAKSYVPSSFGGASAGFHSLSRNGSPSRFGFGRPWKNCHLPSVSKMTPGVGIVASSVLLPFFVSP